MSNPDNPIVTPAQQLLAEVETLLAEAARLRAAVSHETMRAQVDQALPYLTHAKTWLTEENIGAQAPVLANANLALVNAAALLEVVAERFKSHGPNAMLCG